MSQTMIIAKMQADHASQVAEIFARYDATEMPYQIGVTSRSLYRFHDLYVHLIDFARPSGEAMGIAQQLPSFRAVSEELKRYINAYDPNWRSPRDAMAIRFYHWTASQTGDPTLEYGAIPLPTSERH
jgi:Polyketide synthesis cyclase